MLALMVSQVLAMTAVTAAVCPDVALAAMVAASPTRELPEPIPFNPVALGLRTSEFPDDDTAFAASALTTCSPGYEWVCEDAPDGGKPICRCRAVPGDVTTGTVTPAFYILHVYYDVPGAGSTTRYTNASRTGSTTTNTDTWSNTVTLTANVGWELIGGSVDISGNRAWGSTTTDQVDVQVTQTQGYTVRGYGADYVDHGNDRIWFVIRPVINLTHTAATPAKPANVSWAFAATQPMTSYIYWVYVGWLTNPSSMPTNVRDLLAEAGITASYYSELLKADPFAYGVTPGQHIDSDRFEFVTTVPYPPLNSPTAPSSTTDYGLQRSVTSSTTTTRDVSYSVTVKATTDHIFTTASASNQFVWKSSSSTKTATGTDLGEVITVGQPSYGYAGPTVLRVYVDRIWKTFFIAQDWQ